MNHRLSSGEWDSRLDGVAHELQQAHPQPTLSEGFLDSVLSKATPIWSFRRALQSNLWIRNAAAILVLLTGSVPVLAVIALLQKPEKPEHSLVFLLPESPPVVENLLEPDPGTILPAVPVLQDPLDESWMLEMQRKNAALQWAYWCRTTAPTWLPGCPLWTPMVCAGRSLGEE
ncbi:MAG: hypothetical protein MK213_05290 [Planctomycetes bacterium]|nr:hypothetical protein [Planctomycetota bacterium]